jgi:tetratricopeptide (TPR) repeat protein
MADQALTLLWRIALAVLGIPLAIGAGAIFLRAACQLCRVPVPRFLKAMGVVFVTALACGAVWAIVLFLTQLPRPPPGAPDDSARALLARLLAVPFLILIPAAIYQNALAIESLRRAIFVRVAELGIAVVLTLAVLGVVVVGIYATDRIRNPVVHVPEQPREDPAVLRERLAQSRRSHAVNLMEEGERFVRAGSTREADVAFRDALTLWKQLAADARGETEFRQQQARCQAGLGALAARNRQTKESLEAYQEAAALWRQLAAEFPAEPQYPEALAQSLRAQAGLLRQTGANAVAAATYRDALGLLEPLTRTAPERPAAALLLAETTNELADLLAAMGQTDEAEAAWRQAAALGQQLVGTHTEPAYRRALARSRAGLAGLLAQRGRRPEAESTYRKAMALDRALATEVASEPAHRAALAQDQQGLARLLAETGRPAEAEPVYREALALRRQLVAEQSTQADYRKDLAETLLQLALLLEARKDLDAARRLLEEAVPHHEATRQADSADPRIPRLFRDNRGALAEICLSLGDHAKAAQAARQLLEVRVDPGPDAYHAAHVLVRCVPLAQKDAQSSATQRDALIGTYELEASSALRQALERGPVGDHAADRSDFEPLRHLAESQAASARQQPAQAQRYYQAAADVWQQLATCFPAVPDYHRELAQTWTALAELATSANDLYGARDAYRKAIASLKTLAGGPADARTIREQLARCNDRLGRVQEKNRIWQDAEAAYRESLALWQQLAADHPDAAGYRQAVAAGYLRLADYLHDGSRWQQAEPLLQQAIALQKQLAADFPAEAAYRRDLARCYDQLGQIQLRTRRAVLAATTLQDAIAAWKTLATTDHAAPEDRQALAESLGQLAGLYPWTRRLPEAEPPARDALAVWKQLAADLPKEPVYREGLARSYAELGALLHRTGRDADAETAYREAVSLGRKLAAEAPKRAAARNDLAAALVQLALLLRGRDAVEARRLLEEGLPHHEAAVAANYGNDSFRRNLVVNRRTLAEILVDAGDHAAAAVAVRTLLRYSTARTPDSFDAGRLLARCVPLAEQDGKLPEAKRTELAGVYGREAVVALFNAAQSFPPNAARMLKDPALAPLHNRGDFKQLLLQYDPKPRPQGR